MTVDVLVVGAGPAGLAAAIELRKLGVAHVLVVDREGEAGGVPRHCAHTGFGVRDLRRVLSGPAYAKRYAHAAAAAGAELRCGTTVTELAVDQEATLASAAGADRVVARATLTSAAGIEEVPARAMLIATGCRERPRSARLVPGDRPTGVMTTGELQQRVYLAGERMPGRALIVGAEHVSYSAVLTLSHAGADVVALATDLPQQQSYAAFQLGVLARWQVPVWTSVAISRIVGRGRLEAVELVDLRTGAVRRADCETLVFTGDWIPDHELARRAGVVMSPGTKGPAVDTALRTCVPSVFAAGNVIHAAETADVAALGGRHAANQIAAFLRDPAAGAAALKSVPIEVATPLTWIAPNAIGGERTVPSRNCFVLRTDGPREIAHLEVRQDDRLLFSARTRFAPARSITLNADWISRVDPASGPVRVTVR